MKEKATKKFDAINKNAIVGTRPSVVVSVGSAPKKNVIIRKSASIKPSNSRPKPRKCSGCARKRKRG